MADEMMAQGNSQFSVSNPAGAAVAVRSAKEVEAMVLMAKRFPRDEELAEGKIIKACKRERLAQTATYEYPRGGTKVTGVSTKKVWKVRVDDEKAVPSYANGICIRPVDERAIMQLHRLNPNIEIDGVTFFQTEQLAVR